MSLLLWTRAVEETYLMAGLLIAGVIIWRGVAARTALRRQRAQAAAVVRQRLLDQAAAAERARRERFEQHQAEQQAQWEGLRQRVAAAQVEQARLLQEQAATQARLRQVMAEGQAQWEESMKAFERLLDQLNQQSRWMPPSGAWPPIGQQATQPGWAQLLELTLPFTPDELKQAYYRLSRQYHPDAGGTTAQMQNLNAARDQGVEWLQRHGRQ